MKNTLLVVAIATAGLFAVTTLSHAAEDKGGFFVNGSVGQATLNKGIYDDSDTGYQINAGYRWALAPAFAFGIEGGYTDLGKFSPKADLVTVTSIGGVGQPPGVPVDYPLGNAELSGWTLGVNAHWNLSDSWYVSGRTGLFSADAKGYALDASPPFRVDGSSNDWYAGAGFGYDFSNNFSVGLNYDYYKAGKNDLNLDTGLVSVSGEIRF
ncbi:outer membrane beta-barrel protein [Dokdonella sp.]|uniref:outer membrane beta-barrel protein n=1 Tax=Dokdonella sp. TaxID=2291710 RepID=UPI003C59A7E6